MLSPRWNKVKRDLLSNKFRTLLVVLTISVGVVAFGSVFITRDTLLTNLNNQFNSGKSSSINFTLNSFDESLVNYVKTLSSVSDAQGRAVTNVKLITSERDYDLDLYSYPDFNDIRMNIPVPEQGNWPPKKNEIILERATANYTKLNKNQPVTVELSNGKKKELQIAGIARQSTAPPPQFTGMLTAFADHATLEQLGYDGVYNRLEIRPTSDIDTLAKAESLASDIKESLKNRGILVKGSIVFEPDKSPGEDPSNAFTAILVSIGIFSLILSAFLVVNTISAIITSQRQQIGIMKAIGATSRQINWMYIVMVLSFGAISLLIALPLSLLLGYVFLSVVTEFVNLRIEYFSIAPYILFLILFSVFCIPVLAALYPIISGSKLSIKDALSATPAFKKDIINDMFLSKVTFLSRPALLSFRNMFRKRGRLFLTMSTLIIGGTLFISVINVRQSMLIELQRLLELFDFGVTFSLDQPYDNQPLKKRALLIPNVTEAEGRITSLAQEINTNGKSKGLSFLLTGVPADSTFITPTLLNGRWLKQDDKNAVVLSSGLLRNYPSLIVGSQINLEIEDKMQTYDIVGIVSSNDTVGFTNLDAFAKLLEKPGKATQLLVKTNPNTASVQDTVATTFEENLKRSGIRVVNTQKRHVLESSIASSFDFLVGFLLVMAVMVAIVGGLGLAGTMGLNVMERTREIGVMRSIGATNGAIGQIFILEAVFIAFFSWILALPLSIPFTRVFDIAIGQSFFQRVLVFSYDPKGALVWLVVVLVIAIISSVLPSRSAVKMSIRDTLAYE